MAQSLDALIDFLLEEIALSGEKGLELSDIVKSANNFYEKQRRLDLSDNTDSSPENATIDRNFVEQLWRWLGKHPDVLLGVDAQYNRHSLVDIEKKYPGYITQALERTTVDLSNDPEESFSRSNVVSHDDVEVVSSTNNAVRQHFSKNKGRSEGPRIYVTSDRMFLAICGHLPDPARVFPSEWMLLSFIAAARDKGILQGELGRVAGQDKRSVPKRTDQLQLKGYVVKRTAYLKGTKTSRLFLQRFAPDDKEAGLNNDVQDAKKSAQPSVRSQATQMFELLKNSPLLTQDSLEGSLAISTAGKRKVLSLVIRHFSRAGCIKRIKTAFGPSAHSGDLQICLQYLRQPQDADWTTAASDGLNFDSSIDELAKPYDDVMQSDPDDRADDLIEDMELESDAMTDGKRTIPQWNPDRILANVLFEATKLTGSAGMKNIDARKMITGPFVRRVLESLLVKVSHRSLQSQPSGVKHLTILRSKETTESLLHYVHYALSCFEEKIGQGKASWSDVEGCPKSLLQASANSAISESLKTHSTDRFGFPVGSQSKTQIHGGAVTQYELIRQAKVRDIRYAYGETASDEPTTVADDSTPREQSSYGIVPTPKRGRPRKSLSIAQIPDDQEDYHPATSMNRGSVGHITRGRPRKFLRGTEKFWKDMFITAVRQADPDHVRTMGTGGVMKSSVGTEMFAARPDKFDETVIRAMDAGLPVPGVPQDITERWVSDTIAVLDLPENGLYFTQIGVQRRSRGAPSKFMVLKNVRLKEVDFSDRCQTWEWQSICSSASHSFRYRRFYPTLGPSSKKTGFIMRPPKLPKPPKVSSTSGPPRGTFYEHIQQTPDPDQDQVESVSESPALKQSEQARARASSVSTGTDPELSQNITQAEARSGDIVGAPATPLSIPPSLSVDHDISTRQDELAGPVIKRSGRHKKPTQKALEGLQNAEGAHNSPSSMIGARLTGQRHHVRSNSSNTERTFPIVAESLSQIDDMNTELILPPQPSSMQVADTEEMEVRHEVDIGDHAAENYTAMGTENPFPITTAITKDAEPTVNAPMMIVERLSDGQDVSANPKDSLPDPPHENDDDDDEVVVHASRRRKRVAVGDSSDELESVRPVKKLKSTYAINRISQRAPAKMCRTIIYDLLKLCSGLAPCDSWTFRRAMTARWAESGIESEPPTAKHVRTNLKALATGARVRNITFAYRGKSGAMVTKTIIALKRFDNTSPEVLDLQKKMADTDPEDYVPPELFAEFNRAPSDVINQATMMDTSDTEVEHSASFNTPPRNSVSMQDRIGSVQTTDNQPTSVNNCFLTLRVPCIRSLNLPAEFSVRYKTVGQLAPGESALPARPSRSSSPTTPIRRRGLRKRRTTRFDAETHNIVWTNNRQLEVPESIEDIPNIKLYRDQAVLGETVNHANALFVAEVDCVAAWEEKSRALNEVQSPKLAFINHTAAQNGMAHHPIKLRKFIYHTTFDENGAPKEQKLSSASSWPVFVEALRQVNSVKEPPAPIHRQKRKYPKRKKSFVVDDDEADPDASIASSSDNNDDDSSSDEDVEVEEDAPRKRRKITRRRGRNVRPSSSRTKADKIDGQKRTAKKLRRPVQVVRYMPKEIQYRIVVSVIIVRTLAGGLERFIDWNLVKRLVPDLEEEHIQIAWRSLLSRYRTDVNELTESLQDKYLDDLIEGKVPSVNFADLKATNWEGILEWATSNLEKLETEKVDELPASRELFYNQNDLTFEESLGIRHTLGFGILTSQSRKDELMGGIVFGMPLSSIQQGQAGTDEFQSTDAQDKTLVKAKSWIFALLLTDEATFDPGVAHKRLLELATTPGECETLVAEALSSLQREKAISKERNASKASASLANEEVSGVRTWQVSNKYYEHFNFRRQITSSMLKVAAKYKLEVLDVAFSQDQPVIIGQEFTSDDGEMVAIVNLLAMGALTIRTGNDVPDTRYGLDWEKQGYSTRLIDKATLAFSVILEPVPFTYAYGDPLDDSRSRFLIPRGEIDNPAGIGRIPPWFDINLDFLPHMWDMFVGAMVGLVSIRPGSDAVELSKSAAGALGSWEVSLITGYLEEIGAVKKTRSGNGYETEPWWWMSLAATNDVEAVEDEDIALPG